MEWFALLIPLFAVIVGMTYFKRKFTIGELFLPVGIGLFLIFICRICVKHGLVQDREYWGSMVVEARYYEYWETWVDQTCIRSYSCNCDDKGNCETCTETYDCSYCSSHPEHWEAYDNAGNSWEISQIYYNYLKQKWLCVPQFVDMERSIDHSHACGQDGDMYRISWDGSPMRSEAAVTIHSYINKVQASKSAFKLQPVNRREAKALGLHPYPKLYDHYKQNVLLGLDSIYSRDSITYFETLYQYFNGRYGKDNKIKLFLCLFYNKDISVATQQENYWDGGNQNELVVCIGMDRASKRLQWVKPFSWTDQKRVLVDIREDVMNTGTFNPLTTYDAIHKAVNNNVMYKNFEADFNYLKVPLPPWSLWLIYILVFIASMICFIWGLTNDIDNGFYEQDHGSGVISVLHEQSPLKQRLIKAFYAFKIWIVNVFPTKQPPY